MFQMICHYQTVESSHINPLVCSVLLLVHEIFENVCSSYQMILYQTSYYDLHISTTCYHMTDSKKQNNLSTHCLE